MKKLIILLLMAFVGAAGWSVGSQLSRDALGMSVGVLLGVIAGIPVALLVLAAGRRSMQPDYDDGPNYYQPPQAQAPVIMLMGNGQPQQWQGGQMPGQQQPHQLAAPQWHGAPAGAYDLWETADGGQDY